MDDTLNKIEAAIKERLKLRMPKVNEFDVGKDFSAILTPPAVSVTTERIGVSVEYSAIEFRPVISVYAVVKGVQLADRHKGIYPIITFIAAELSGQTFGLEIEPLKPVTPMVEVFHPAASAQGLRVYKVDFDTAFALGDNEEGGTLERLLVTANEYIYREHELGRQVIALPNNIEEDGNAGNG